MSITKSLIQSPQRTLPCIEEPINALLLETTLAAQPVLIYANVMTIKDQWGNESAKTFKDRVDEQLLAMSKLAGRSFVVGGDFNCCIGHREGSLRQLAKFVEVHCLRWLTRHYEKTVQHIIHSSDLEVRVDDPVFDICYSKHGKTVDKRTGLSDHPFMGLIVNRSTTG